MPDGLAMHSVPKGNAYRFAAVFIIRYHSKEREVLLIRKIPLLYKIVLDFLLLNESSLIMSQMIFFVNFSLTVRLSFAHDPFPTLCRPLCAGGYAVLVLSSTLYYKGQVKLT